MIYELKLINFLMTSKIKKEGEDTSPKGIVDEVKKYNTTLYEAASKIHKNELRRALKLSNSKFKQFRLITENSFEKDPVLELEGYIKLFGKSKELLELYPAARILQNLLDFLRKNSSKKDNTHCLLWYYGDLKEKHSIYLRNKGMNEKEIINERVYIDGECGMAGIYAV
jgi:hypothetical protein